MDSFSFFISKGFGCEMDSSVLSCPPFSCSIYSYRRKSFSGNAAANVLELDSEVK